MQITIDTHEASLDELAIAMELLAKLRDLKAGIPVNASEPPTVAEVTSTPFIPATIMAFGAQHDSTDGDNSAAFPGLNAVFAGVSGDGAGMPVPSLGGLGQTAPADVDSAGVPYDPVLHAKNRAKNQDGTWRAARKPKGETEVTEAPPAPAPSAQPAALPAFNLNPLGSSTAQPIDTALRDGIFRALSEAVSKGQIAAGNLAARLANHGIPSLPSLALLTDQAVLTAVAREFGMA